MMSETSAGSTVRSAKGGAKYQAIGKRWKENWVRVVPFFEFPAEVRKGIYTMNVVESLHMSLWKIIRREGSFPNEEAAVKLLYLALRNVIRKWVTVQGTGSSGLRQDLGFPSQKVRATIGG
jgi:transposase-like protein